MEWPRCIHNATSLIVFTADNCLHFFHCEVNLIFYLSFSLCCTSNPTYANVYNSNPMSCIKTTWHFRLSNTPFHNSNRSWQRENRFHKKAENPLNAHFANYNGWDLNLEISSGNKFPVNLFKKEAFKMSYIPLDVISGDLTSKSSFLGFCNSRNFDVKRRPDNARVCLPLKYCIPWMYVILSLQYSRYHDWSWGHSLCFQEVCSIRKMIFWFSFCNNYSKLRNTL